MKTNVKGEHSFSEGGGDCFGVSLSRSIAAAGGYSMSRSIAATGGCSMSRSMAATGGYSISFYHVPAEGPRKNVFWACIHWIKGFKTRTLLYGQETE